MKKLPWLRYIVLGLFVHLLLYILGVLLFPIYFLLRKPIAKYKIPFLWWFLNSDEKDYISNTYGDEEYRKKRGFDYEKASLLRKIWEAHLWMAWRNSHWNFRVGVFSPKGGTPYNIEIIRNSTYPITEGMTFCNYSIWGEQYGKYYVEDFKYFRYSFTKDTPKWQRLLGAREKWNLHMGWAKDRWIFKCRWFTPKKK